MDLNKTRFRADCLFTHLGCLRCREAVERAVPVVLSADKRSSLVSLQDRLQASRLSQNLTRFSQQTYSICLSLETDFTVLTNLRGYLRLLSLQALSAADFLKILEAILIVSAPCLGHAASIKNAVSDILAAARAPTALLAEAAQGCTDAITAASEAAHACWVRLLNAR